VPNNHLYSSFWYSFPYRSIVRPTNVCVRYLVMALLHLQAKMTPRMVAVSDERYRITVSYFRIGLWHSGVSGVGNHVQHKLSIVVVEVCIVQ